LGEKFSSYREYSKKSPIRELILGPEDPDLS